MKGIRFSRNDLFDEHIDVDGYVEAKYFEAYSKVPPAAKNTNPRTTANTRPYNPNGRLNPV